MTYKNIPIISLPNENGQNYHFKPTIVLCVGAIGLGQQLPSLISLV